MTNEQRENLIRLADYLDSVELLAKFDMACYDDNIWDTNGRENCGTVGCAVGHGPYAGISKDRDECWVTYSERVFGLNSTSIEWEYCFSSDWNIYDNSSMGAARRIRNLLDGGKIKMPWKED